MIFEESNGTCLLPQIVLELNSKLSLFIVVFSCGTRPQKSQFFCVHFYKHFAVLYTTHNANVTLFATKISRKVVARCYQRQLLKTDFQKQKNAFIICVRVK